MTKIGEGSDPHEVSIDQYHKDIDASSLKFLNALQMYNSSAEGVDKEHLKTIMDQQLDVIRSSISELKRAGIQKQEAKVETDYKNYMSSPSPENLAALEHDLLTLREYNQLP